MYVVIFRVGGGQLFLILILEQEND